jgi:hypothetical protein
LIPGQGNQTFLIRTSVIDRGSANGALFLKQVRTAEKSSDCGHTGLLLRTNISLKSCGYEVLEVLPTSWGVAIADLKRYAHLCKKVTKCEEYCYDFLSVGVDLMGTSLFPFLVVVIFTHLLLRLLVNHHVPVHFS